MDKRNYQIRAASEVFFNNRVDYCVGTGRMGLALTKEYQEQLKLVQDEIGFSHIRGHGLFCEDMAIYQEYEDAEGKKHAEYNFTYLDLVMDSYHELHIKPFLELGFMPKKLASGEQTVFYWKGNVTPPSDYGSWCELVQATLRHLMERYGADYVVTWPVEVWNEPNLPGFWKDADMEEYFTLFKHTFYAVKAVDERFRVGGPAICGVDDENWIRSFMSFCRKEQIPLDFVTRHHYTTELPTREGHYSYTRLIEPEYGFANLQTTRDIIDSFAEYKGLEIHITEFNTSYVPDCPLHDTNENAAYIANQLSRLGDVNESYSYWTFGDIFEEQGIPFSPFYGGFGLVANGGIPKPTLWTMKFFKDLQGKCVHRSGESVVIKRDDAYRGVVWNFSMEAKEPFTIHFELEMEGTEYGIITKMVDEDTCNPLKAWHALGEPASLSPSQKALLKEAARPLVQADRKLLTDKKAVVELTLEKNAVVYFEVFPVTEKSDRGYHYNAM